MSRVGELGQRIAQSGTGVRVKPTFLTEAADARFDCPLAINEGVVQVEGGEALHTANGATVPLLPITAPPD